MNIHFTAPFGEQIVHNTDITDNIIKVVSKMTTSSYLTGQESVSDLLELRRAAVRSRRERRAAMIFGSAAESENADTNSKIITFPAADTPLTA